MPPALLPPLLKWAPLLLDCAQIRRPNNYDITLALMLGPTDPNPTMDVSNRPLLPACLLSKSAAKSAACLAPEAAAVLAGHCSWQWHQLACFQATQGSCQPPPLPPALALTPPASSTPPPASQLVPLEVVKTVVQDSPHKLFIGGLPCDWSEEQVRESNSWPDPHSLRQPQLLARRPLGVAEWQPVLLLLAAGWLSLQLCCLLLEQPRRRWGFPVPALSPCLLPAPRPQVKEMLLPFGQLKAFNLVMDRGTGNSKVGAGQGPGAGAGRAALCVEERCARLQQCSTGISEVQGECGEVVGWLEEVPYKLWHASPWDQSNRPLMYHLPPPLTSSPPPCPPPPQQGYAFAEFMDVHVTDIVIQNLNGKPCNTKFLTGEQILSELWRSSAAAAPARAHLLCRRPARLPACLPSSTAPAPLALL